MISLRPELSNNFAILSPISSTIQLYSSTNSSPAYANIPHNGLLWFGLEQHYPFTPGSTNFRTLLLNPVNRHCRIGSDKTLPLLSSLEGANSPFLCTTSTAVLRATATNSMGFWSLRLLASQQPPSFLPIEEDSSERCPRYPLVDIEQDENPTSVAFTTRWNEEALHTWHMKGLLNDRHNPGRRRKGQRGSRVLQPRIGSRGEVEIGRQEACCRC